MGTIAVILGLFLSMETSSLADCTPQGCMNEQVTLLYTQASGDIYFKTTGNMGNLTCTLLSGLYFTLPANISNFDAIYSNLLISRTLQTPISVRTASTGPCVVYYVTF